jgi:hypothetical protein
MDNFWVGEAKSNLKPYVIMGGEHSAEMMRELATAEGLPADEVERLVEQARKNYSRECIDGVLAILDEEFPR